MRQMRKAMALIAVLMLLGSATFADSLVTIYEEIKSDFPDFTDRLIAGGATEAEIEHFLSDLGGEVRDGGELTEDNFEGRIYEALKEVLFIDGNMAMIQEEHFDFTVALLFEFTDEIEETLETKRLSGDLVALSEAVKNALLDEDASGDETVPVVSATGPGEDLSILSVETLSLEVLLERVQALEESGEETCLTIDFGDQDEAVLPALDSTFEKLASLVLQLESGEVVLGPDTLMQGIIHLPLRFEMVRVADDQFEVNLSVKGDPVTRFNRPLKLSVAYALEDGQTDASLTVVCEGEDGTLENLGGLYREGRMVFFTSHLSTFRIVTSEKRFSDIGNEHYAKSKIEALVSKGIISGKGDGIFDPDASITRVETACLIARMLKLNTDTNSVPFTDIEAGKWYTEEVVAAYESGLVAGRGDGRFDPLGWITRQEVLSILSRALVREGYAPIEYKESANVFGEAVVSAWAQADIGLALDRGLVNDLPESSLVPDGNATRAEVANMLYEMLDELY